MQARVVALRAVSRRNSKRVHRHISRSVCPWNAKCSVELAQDSPFQARAFIAKKDSGRWRRTSLALGRWDFAEFREIYQIGNDFPQKMAQAFNALIDTARTSRCPRPAEPRPMPSTLSRQPPVKSRCSRHAVVSPPASPAFDCTRLHPAALVHTRSTARSPRRKDAHPSPSKRCLLAITLARARCAASSAGSSRY